MRIRRAALLFLGFACSMFVSAVLYISAEGTLATQETYPTASQTQDETVPASVPATVPGTTLQIERLSAYEGPFLEDGSDMEVVDIAALHIRNVGDRALSRVCVTLQYESGSYVFCGAYIPVGVTVVLLEREAQTYLAEDFTDCYGWQMPLNEEIQSGVVITDRNMGTVLATNVTDQALFNVRLHYKTWLSSEDVYVGGITYTVEIPVLLPGQTEYLYPPRYAVGYTKVLLVTAGEYEGRR